MSDRVHNVLSKLEGIGAMDGTTTKSSDVA